MGKITTGDLVCMYRRKKKGMGIVLEKVENIDTDLELDTNECLVKMGEFKSFEERRLFEERQSALSNNPKLAKVFFTYNGHAWCRKRKTKFARVRWFNAPSNYENNMMREDDGWYPAEWLRKV